MAMQLVNTGMRVVLGSDWLYTLHKDVFHHSIEHDPVTADLLGGENNSSYSENSDECSIKHGSFPA